MSVQVSDLTLSYPPHGGVPGFEALSGVTFSVAPGEVLAVLGESGAGKSTLLGALSGRGLLAPKGERLQLSGGDATVLGRSLAGLRRKAIAELAAEIGYISQQAGASLPGEMRVADIVAAGPRRRNKKVATDALARLITTMFEIVDLPLEMLGNYPSELSKGQRQRVAIIAELTAAPRLLIADEITNGVDANARPKITELLRWYREQTRATMLLVSHDISLLEQLADTALVLRAGQVVGFDSLNSVFRDVKHPYVAQLADALRRTAYDEAAARHKE